MRQSLIDSLHMSLLASYLDQTSQSTNTRIDHSQLSSTPGNSALEDLYQLSRQSTQAQEAFEKAGAMVRDLAGRIKDEKLQTNFLTAPQVQYVVAR